MHIHSLMTLFTSQHISEFQLPNVLSFRVSRLLAWAGLRARVCVCVHACMRARTFGCLFDPSNFAALEWGSAHDLRNFHGGGHANHPLLFRANQTKPVS